MDELLLAEAYRDAFSLMWSNLQWWASVSFGLLALASFGRRHLSRPATIGLTGLYTLFSAYTLINTFFVGFQAKGVLDELRLLQESGSASSVTESILFTFDSMNTINLTIFLACYFATFLGSLAYLWIAHRKNAQLG